MQEKGRDMTRTRMEISMTMMRPNRKGSRGPRIARTMKKPMYKDHGRLLVQRYETTQDRG